MKEDQGMDYVFGLLVPGYKNLFCTHGNDGGFLHECQDSENLLQW